MLSSERFETNPFINQLREQLARKPNEPEPRKEPEGSPYEAPKIHSFIVQKGPRKGERKFVLQFKHKRNPAWSRSLDVVDLELILEHQGKLEAALAALLTVQKV